MISAILIVLFVLLTVLLGMRLAKGHVSGIKSPEDLRSQLRVVDIDAFRCLTDPNEEDFLRSRLSGAAYRRVRRQRLRATFAYVSCVANNAAVLIRLGEEARGSTNTSVADAGARLLDNGLRLRLQTFQVKARLYLQIVYPGGQNPSGEFMSLYEQMTRQGLLLSRLQYPGRGISSAF